MSNEERITRAAAEAEASAKQQARKKAAAPAVRTRTPKPPPRLKIVWAVGKPGIEPVKIFPYLERPAADAKAAALGDGFLVMARKVPME